MYRRFSTIAAAAATAILLAGVPALQAQDSGAAQQQTSTYGRRFSAGVRMGVIGGPLMNSEELRNSSSSPAIRSTFTTSSVSSYFTGGGTVEYYFTRRVSLLVDVMYRRPGYSRGETIVTGFDDPDTTVNEEKTARQFEITHATFWDVPVLLRFYDSGYDVQRTSTFFDVGGAYRHVSGIRSFREFEPVSGSAYSDSTPASPKNRSIVGVVAGVGFQFRTDSEIKVAPEIRYTRWFNTTFDDTPTRSTKNQLEFLIGITF